MTSIEDINLDIEELQTLQEQASRKRVQEVLTIEIRKLQTELIARQEKEKVTENKANEEKAKPVSVKTVTPGAAYSTEITRYGWDESDKFMKIYVTLNGVQDISKENIKSQFTKRSFRLDVNGLNNKNLFCEVKHLFGDVLPSESYHKVKTDKVLLMLKKAEQRTWAYVTEQEQKVKEKKKKPPPPASSDDPQAGLMELMKQLYEEGDDEMKRTIAKAWTESREKGAKDPLQQSDIP